MFLLVQNFWKIPMFRLLWEFTVKSRIQHEPAWTGTNWHELAWRFLRAPIFTSDLFIQNSRYPVFFLGESGWQPTISRLATWMKPWKLLCRWELGLQTFSCTLCGSCHIVPHLLCVVTGPMVPGQGSFTLMLLLLSLAPFPLSPHCVLAFSSLSGLLGQGGPG